MTDAADRIPPALRQQVERQREQRGRAGSPDTGGAARGSSDATAAKILALGASVATGVAIVGGMAAGSAAVADAPPAAAPVERVIVVQIPALAANTTPTNTAVPMYGATAAVVTTGETAPPTQVSATPEPKPVTVSEGS